MKTGKISQAVLDRSVLRPLSMSGVKGADVAAGSDAAACTVSVDAAEMSDRSGAVRPSTTRLSTARSLSTAVCCGAIGGRFDRTPDMILTGVVNNLAAAGALCSGVMLSVMLPAEEPEDTLKELMRGIGTYCRLQGISVLGGDTQVSEAVSRPVLSVTGYGMRISESDDQAVTGQSASEQTGSAQADPEQTASRQTALGQMLSGTRSRQIPHPTALVMTGCAGQAGTGILAADGREMLSARFTAGLIREASLLGKAAALSVQRAARTACRCGEYVMHDVSVGGVFAALWELAQRGNFGFEVDLKAIPIRQETIEICEVFDVNPYQLFGQGALLIAAADPTGLCHALRAEGIEAVILGSITSSGSASKARILRNGEEIRYLDKPQQDELWKLQR